MSTRLLRRPAPRARTRGVSLVELLMFIVIISVAMVGIVHVLNLNASNSFDPLMRKQALAIAEGLLEEVQLAKFTFCDGNDGKVDTATSAADCAVPEVLGPEAGNSRPFDNVNDYAGASYTVDVAGKNLPSGYRATVSVINEAGLGPAGALTPAAAALRITVTVSYVYDTQPGKDPPTIELVGYRTRYAPNTI